MNTFVRLILSTIAVYIIIPKIYKSVNRTGNDERIAILITILVGISIVSIIFSVGLDSDDGSEIDWTIK